MPVDKAVEAANLSSTKRETDMNTKEIQTWLAYWTNAKMVAVDAIRAFDQVYQARKYCECMRVGVFTDVTDLQIWNAITQMRAA